MRLTFKPWHLVAILLSPVFPPLLLVVLACMIQVDPPRHPAPDLPMPPAWWAAVERAS